MVSDVPANKPNSSPLCGSPTLLVPSCIAENKNTNEPHQNSALSLSKNKPVSFALYYANSFSAESAYKEHSKHKNVILQASNQQQRKILVNL